MNQGSYYQAHVVRSQAWFFVAILRSFEHLAFDRTFCKKESIFEFYVTEGLEEYFLEVMRYFEQQKIISNLEKISKEL